MEEGPGSFEGGQCAPTSAGAVGYGGASASASAGAEVSAGANVGGSAGASSGAGAGPSASAVGDAPAVADGEEKTDRPKSPLAMALLHVKWASFLQKAGQHERAVEHYTSSLALFPSAKAHFGRGTCLANLRRRQEAVQAFEEALRLKPTMVGARVNLVGVLVALRRFSEAEYQCRQALALEPGACEAVMNLANALRNLGRREEAVALVWEHILAEDPSAVDCQRVEAASALSAAQASSRARIHCSDWERLAGSQPLRLVVVCVKWGTRYDANYVNRLHAAVRRQLPQPPAAFVCFTDDAGGLDDGIDARPLPSGLSLWWGKAYLFSQEAGLDGSRVLCLDLDQVVVGSLAAAAAYSGPFAVLATDGIACELAGGGYNSSVMSWEASPFFRPIYEQLSQAALKYVHRFDHWLEMMVEGADLWQDVAPGCVVDYTTVFLHGVCLGSAEEPTGAGDFVVPDGDAEAQQPSSPGSAGQAELPPEEPPDGAAVVTFPRFPKPHEVLERHPWARRHWLGEEEEA